MSKSNKKSSNVLFQDKATRAAKIAYSKAKIQDYAKNAELEHWMDLDNDLALGNTRTYQKPEMRY